MTVVVTEQQFVTTVGPLIPRSEYSSLPRDPDPLALRGTLNQEADLRIRQNCKFKRPSKKRRRAAKQETDHMRPKRQSFSSECGRRQNVTLTLTIMSFAGRRMPSDLLAKKGILQSSDRTYIVYAFVHPIDPMVPSLQSKHGPATLRSVTQSACI